MPSKAHSGAGLTRLPPSMPRTHEVPPTLGWVLAWALPSAHGWTRLPRKGLGLQPAAWTLGPAAWGWDRDRFSSASLPHVPPA